MTERQTRRLPYEPTDDDVTLPYHRKDQQRRREEETQPMPVDTE